MWFIKSAEVVTRKFCPSTSSIDLNDAFSLPATKSINVE